MSELIYSAADGVDVERQDGVIDAAALASKLVNHPCTFGWDVVCSFDVYALNSILQGQFKDIKNISTISLGCEDKPYSTSYSLFNVSPKIKGVVMDQANYIFKLKVPSLQFLAGDQNLAVLEIPIEEASKSELSYTLSDAGDDDRAVANKLENNEWYIRDKISREFVKRTQEEVLADCWDSSKKSPKDPFPDNYYRKIVDSSIGEKSNNKLYNLSCIELSAGESNILPSIGGEYYKLKAMVPLMSVVGGEIKNAGDVVEFDARSDKKEGRIILNFDITAGGGARFTLLDLPAKSKDSAGGSENRISESPASELLKEVPMLLYSLEVYFSQELTGIEIYLAEVSSGNMASDKVPNSIPIRPQCFRFAITKISDSAALSIYINIDGSGTPVPGQALPFMYNAQEIGLPIPYDHTGSLILSRDFLTRYYFPRAFSRAGFKDVSPLGNSASPISFEGILVKSTRIEGEEIETHLSAYKRAFSGFESADFETFEINEYKFTFSIDYDRTLSIASSKVAEVGIPVNIHSKTSGSQFTPPHHDTKRYTATAKLGIDERCDIENTKASSDGFGFGFSVKKSNYSVDVTSDFNWTCTGSVKEDVENDIKNKIGDLIPNIDIDLPELQLLAVENILFNGEVRFHLDPKASMHFPHDLLIVGDLVK